MNRPKRVRSEQLVNGFITVNRERLVFDDKRETDYFIVSTGKDSVIVVALDSEGRFLVTKEYRHAVGEQVYGFSGGLIDEGEGAISAAKRELLEETGCMADSFELIGSFYPLPGLLKQKMHVVLARNVKKIQPQRLETSEIIETTFLTKEALEDLLKSGYAADAAMCTGLFFLSMASVT